ncbi:hypothetical protein RUND412_007381 [Rhizina undulata]
MVRSRPSRGAKSPVIELSDEDEDVQMEEAGSVIEDDKPKTRRRLVKKVVDTEEEKDEQEEEDFEMMDDLENKENKKLFMVAVEIPLRVAKTPAKAIKQLSITNFFGNNLIPKESPVIVEPKAKGRPKALPAKPFRASQAGPLKTSSVKSVPRKPRTKKPSPAALPSKVSRDSDDEQEDSDFAPAGEISESDAASAIGTESDDDVMISEPDSEEENKPKGKSLTASIKALKVSKASKLGEIEKHRAQPVPCGLNITPLPSDLPPITEVQDMFDDIVSRLPECKKIFENGRRKLRVATMCSGTESPLLAMGMIARSMKERGWGILEMEHVFSCEIEPYKQAYIERNFKPPILFRDVRELGQDYAHTAYGAMVAVPGDVDILIAGTSCVDASNLNNQKKEFGTKGESTDTFVGMFEWVTRHRPMIIIQENVSGAAWSAQREMYLRNGYSCEFKHNFDTKHYYIPHTRQRGYLFALNMKNSNIPNKWIDAMKKMERPCSTTIDSFLLPSDDPRIYQARLDLVAGPRDSVIKRTVDWDKCEGRHQKERMKSKLGNARPMTMWQESGTCQFMDFVWADWGNKQVDRVLDLMDINMLLLAKEGIDPHYKSQFWNLSQNVDRNTFGKGNGISPCLTPHMIPYLTDRGGPMIGLEALHMQGLPINQLLLTRESSQELQNLAGNAMSSTVVGTAILTALILSIKHLRSTENDDMDTDMEEQDISKRIKGDEQLIEKPLDLVNTEALEMNKILEDARKSSRHCACEGRTGMTENQLKICKKCGFTSCEKCGIRPEHRYEVLDDAVREARISPLTFEETIKSVLPMRLRLSGIDEDTLDNTKANYPKAAGAISSSDWTIWKELFIETLGSEFRFKNLMRQEIWTATYDAPHGYLELLLDTAQPEWRLFAKCARSEGVNSRKRKICQLPFARMKLASGRKALDGDWEICVPTKCEFMVDVQGKGQLVKSWEAGLGLEEPRFAEKQVWDHLHIEIPEDAKSYLDRDISGDYELLPDCGTANGALHKRISGDNSEPSIFFFLDPTRCGDVSVDPFVFSTSFRKLNYSATRPVVAKLDPTFRQFSDDSKNSKCFVQGQWLPVHNVTFAPPVGNAGTISDGVFSIPSLQGLDVSVTNDDCAAANAILVCRIPMQNQAEEVWPRSVWKEVDKVKEKITFESLAWLTERVKFMSHLSDWHTLELPAGYCNCERCSPTAPDLKWVYNGKKFAPMENPEQAADFERRLKNRPNPFVTQLMLDDNNVGILRIGLNIPTLVHRALSRLPSEGRTETPTVSWRLITNYIPSTQLILPEFELTSNKRNKPYKQPPNFILKLRPEQLRSLAWMMEQEKADAPPFIEEEISEALLPNLGWRAEGKAERQNQVLGGVLADQVGYGKTAITLGLIDCSRNKVFNPPPMQGAIPVKATLIIVPPHLTNQWPSEITKFTGAYTYKVIKIQNQTQLNALTIKQIQAAEIIVVASSLLKSDKYLSNLAGFAATNSPPSSEGRRFNHWHKDAMKDLPVQVDNLRNGGASFAYGVLDEARRKLQSGENKEVFVQTKRLIGKAYVAAAEKAEKSAKGGKAGTKRKRSAAQSEDNSEEEDSDSSRQKKTKLASRLSGDPWKLKAHAVEKDWTMMQAPPLEMFHFNRLVVDEYTYLKGQIHTAVTALKSTYRWVLSGTPPLDDFSDVKTISVFLGIHLGIDDDMEGKRSRTRKDRTDVENFTAFREVRSTNWHQRRHEIAQAFLNQFVRQNIAEIDEIPYEEHIVPVTLPAAERAIYLELEHHLQALEMNIRKGKLKSDNDRDRRLQESLGDSATAEEALLKRCSQFELDLSKEDEENAVQACEVIVKDRKRQLARCRAEARDRVADCIKRHKEVPKSEFGVDDHFMVFVGVVVDGDKVGDYEANQDIKYIMKMAGLLKQGPDSFVDGTKIKDLPQENYLTRALKKKLVKAKGKGKGKKKEDEDEEETWDDDDEDEWPVTMEAKKMELRSRVTSLRVLVMKELVGRHRSLRYFRIVRDLQQFGLAKFQKKGSVSNINCQECGRKNLPVSDIAVLSSCGHQGCYDCLRKKATEQRCIEPSCLAAARVLNIVKGESLGTEDQKEGIGRHHGMKIEKIITLIKDHIPAGEKVLLFVQFVDLMEKVARVLEEFGVKHIQINGSAAAKSKALDQFQQASAKDPCKVLLLNVMDESASGANLTNANHAIFISPLLTVNDYEYRSCETQAIGRIRRYGQSKTVHVWRFLTENSIDIEIYEQRSGKSFETLEKWKVESLDE